MESYIKIIESGINDGIFSSNIKFHPDLNEEERYEKVKENRINLGKKYGFNGLKIINNIQKGPNNSYSYRDGYYILIDDYLDIEDYWKKQFIADVILITSKTPNVVVGHIMADCPILIAEDRSKKVCAMAHCGSTYIDREVPKNVISALQDKFNSNLDDIFVYIGSYAHKESYIYDRWPLWAKSKIWNDYIENIDGMYHIDMGGAIQKQLEDVGIKNIEISEYDTAKDEYHYSHTASFHGNKEKFGQNFVGFYYKD